MCRHFVCIVYVSCACSVQGQKRTIDLLELKLQRPWASMSVLGIEPQPSRRAVSVLNSWTISSVELSLQVLFYIFLYAVTHQSMVHWAEALGLTWKCTKIYILGVSQPFCMHILTRPPGESSTHSCLRVHCRKFWLLQLVKEKWS